MSKSKVAVSEIVGEWIPKPKYAKTMDNTIGARDAESEAVLKSVGGKAPREGTARAAAYAALVASIGLPRPAVLAAVAEAERGWHMATTRTPKAVSPIGWLKTFEAKF
jgi:hypothetical protein